MSGRRRWLASGAAVLLVLAGAALVAGPAGAHDGNRDDSPVARPIVERAAGGLGIQTLQAMLDEMPTYGYVQDEYLYRGTAQAYEAVGTLPADGRWWVRPTTTAPYRSRLVVRRPSDPARFSGTVVVEWLNVTAGFDTSPDWNFGRIQLMREGAIWIGVSAQSVGIEGNPLGLKHLDPARYGTLSHPGDQYSYDIYSQAAQALVRPRGAQPLAGFHVERLIADGESQSASRMTTYVNAIAPIHHLFDSFLIHSRSAGAASLRPTPVGGPFVPDPTIPNPTFLRTDRRTPVLVVESETDVERYAPARQPDSRYYRAWEIAGTSHVDLYALGPDSAGILGCVLPVNSGPHHYVFHTAVRDLLRWTRNREKAPPSSPRITLDGAGRTVRDRFGNALGGIRTPQLDAPVATLSGFGNSPGLCSLFGTTTRFTDAQLLATYGTRTTYLLRFLQAEARAFDSGFLLRADGYAALVEAAQVPFPA